MGDSGGVDEDWFRVGGWYIIILCNTVLFLVLYSLGVSVFVRDGGIAGNC